MKKSKYIRRHFLTSAVMTFATAVASASGIAPAAAEESLYQELGGQEAIVRISDATIDLSVADPRITHTFDDTNVRRIKRLLAVQICELTGGPCVYDGRTMKESHIDLDLTNAHFNWLVEHMQVAMDQEHISFRTQNKLLAILAPMQRDIVTK